MCTLNDLHRSPVLLTKAEAVQRLASGFNCPVLKPTVLGQRPTTAKAILGTSTSDEV
jgi:hypothetical protein